MVKSGAVRADVYIMNPPISAAPRWARRRIALVAVSCASAIAVGSLVSAQGVETPVELNSPGLALVPAERLSMRPPPVPDGELLFPVDAGSDCYILDNFGDGRGTPTTPRLHEGVDIMGSAGRPVYAVAAGTLTKRYANTGSAGWGWTLYDSSSDTTFKYFHLAEDANGLVEGADVAVGDVLGFVGASGTSSPENFHLHFEVRPGNVAVDPLPLLHVESTACEVSPPIR